MADEFCPSTILCYPLCSLSVIRDAHYFSSLRKIFLLYERPAHGLSRFLLLKTCCLLQKVHSIVISCFQNINVVCHKPLPLFHKPLFIKGIDDIVNIIWNIQKLCLPGRSFRLVLVVAMKNQALRQTRSIYCNTRRSCCVYLRLRLSV